MKRLQGFFWMFALSVFQGAAAQSCATFKENSGTQKFQCAANMDFETLEWRVEMDGALQTVYSCSKSGSCQLNDATKFHGTFVDSNGVQAIQLSILDVDRTMTRLRCFLDGAPTAGELSLCVYAKASELTCEDPVFEDGNSVAVITCTSQTVYPAGKCNFTVTTHDNRLPETEVTSTNTDTGSNGDKTVQCQLRVPVTGSQAGDYQFDASVIPDLEGVPGSATVYADTPPTLKLGAITLYNPEEGNHTFQYPENNQVATQIHVTGNPGPNRMLLSVRYDRTANFAPLSSTGYSATYTPTVGSEGGVISLTIVAGLDGTRESYFMFTADNGVVGGAEFEYYFSVAQDNRNSGDGDDDGSGSGSDGNLNRDGDVEEDDDSSSSLPLIIGAAVAGAALIVLAAAVVICLKQRKKKPIQQRHEQGFISVYSVADPHVPVIRKGSLPPPYYDSRSTTGPAKEEVEEEPEYLEVTDFDPPTDYF